MSTARVIQSGRSQTIKLPKAFCFNTKTVHIRRHGNAVILEPVAKNWEWLDAISGKLDEDFIAATKEQLPQQNRKSLDEFFK